MKPKTEPSTGSLTVIGVDNGKAVFHLVGFGVEWEDCLPQEDQAIGSQRHVRETATVHRQHGSLPERALRQQSAPRIRTRAADHPGDLRQTVHDGAKEPLAKQLFVVPKSPT
jgi:hypothetical protein